MKLDDELDRVIGEGPPHRPIADTIAAGRRTVRRRRALGGGAAAVALVAVVGGWGLAAGDGDTQSRDPGFADSPSAAPASTLPAGGGVSLDADCGVAHASDVRVLETIDDPFGDADDAACVAAVAWKSPDGTWWSTLTQQESGGIVSTTGVRVDGQRPAPTFDDYVRRTAINIYPDLVSFGDTGETLQPAEGVTILDSVAGLTGFPDDYAMPGERTAAALVERGPFRWFVLARDIEGGPDYISQPATDPNETLAQYLDRARSQYQGGKGLL